MTAPKSHPKIRRMVTAVRAVERIRKLLARDTLGTPLRSILDEVRDIVSRVRPPGLDHRSGPRKKPCACPPRNRDAEAFLDDTA